MASCVCASMQLYERRLKAALVGEEREKLTLNYMSDESSMDEDDGMTVHRPPWRSNSKIVCALIQYKIQGSYNCIALNRFMEELDQRVMLSQKDTKKHVPQRKKRVEGTPADSSPPADFQNWTVSTEWLKGTTIHSTYLPAP